MRARDVVAKHTETRGDYLVRPDLDMIGRRDAILGWEVADADGKTMLTFSTKPEALAFIDGLNWKRS
jgi:hypothetical protein